MKFKVGDMVKHIPEEDFTNQNVYRIIGIDTQCTDFPYLCEGADGFTFWLREENIALVKEALKEKENNKMKVFESNRDRTLGDLFPGDYFKFMNEEFEGWYGIVCNCTIASDYFVFGEKPKDKVFCMVFSNEISFPMFGIEDASIEVKKIPGKTIFEED